jgi:RND family efflux transporter MFP subunit
MIQQPSLEKPAPERTGTAEPAPAPNASGSKRKGHGRSGHWAFGIGALTAVALAGSLLAATLPRLRHEKELEAAAARAATSPPLVSVVTARRAPYTSELTLPGNAQAFREAALYARTNGYVKRWLVDIGDRVTEGQLLAEISTPDVDDQLAQARANLVLSRANLQVAEANHELAKITLERDIRSVPKQGVTLLEIDQDRAQVKTTAAQVESARASIRVNEATVQQYADLQSFQKIVASFPGVITARNVDPGALVTADTPSETRELFHLMQTDLLRVFVNVPQVFATSVAPGQQVVVYRQEDPLKRFSGRVTRTARALDPNTRTLLTQVDVPNPDEALQPGMYVQVTFVSARAAPPVLIPGAALVTRNDGSEVALLDEHKTVRYRKVQLGRDYGAEVEVMTGLEGGETVIVHPGDALPEGREVEPAPSPLPLSPVGERGRGEGAAK